MEELKKEYTKVILECYPDFDKVWEWINQNFIPKNSKRLEKLGMPKIAEIKEIYERNEIPMDADAVGLQPIYYPRDQLTKFIEELNLYFEKISNFSA